MNQDLLKDLLEREINNETRMLDQLDQLDLDDISKENIRLRTYNQYRELSFIREMENA
ncbi:hypothetical protein N9C20_05935 [Luminiphilus sp.]|nr:hypothetical protein [Luminiphilus sp.]